MDRTLLLNQSYEPIAAISWRRAICLLMLGKVEAVEEYDRHVRSAKTSFRVPAVVRLVDSFKRHKRRVKFSKQNVFARDRWRCQYCLAPEHTVLTRDFQWVPLGELRVGDKLVAFSESAVPGRRGRRYCNSEVLSHEFSRELVFRIVLDDGTEFRATKEHRWLGKTSNGCRQKWLETADLKNRFLPRLFTPWERDLSYNSGWMAGMFDGEGWIRSKHGIEVALAQNPGEVFARVLQLLDDHNIPYNITPVIQGQPCQRILVAGGVDTQIRALGIFGPKRLIEAADPICFGMVRSAIYRKVVAVETVGLQEIVKMRTSSGTFIADGFPHHNCGQKKPIDELTQDHVVPRSRGGRTCWENIVTACKACNAAKADRTIAESGMRPLSMPQKPDWVPVFTLRIAQAMPDIWRNYCWVKD